ncbi:MAG: serine/threonine protein kinase, partial [Myxococcaceae bacterium]|nr:serine/threonine protein kinase [Myxococcaceae bacterium]
MAHLSDEDVLSFVAGSADEAAAALVEAHIDECQTCRSLVSSAAKVDRASAPTAPDDRPRERTPPTLPAEVGQVIDGRFRLERVLGVGGMGCVYEALQLHLNQKVALKLLLPELSADQSAVTRFLREARSAALLRHPNICQVLDLGILQSGTPFLVMELLRGESVRERLQRQGPFSAASARHVVSEALNAIEAAHAHGIVHRDLKPDNLFFAKDTEGRETVKVLDFGIAKSMHPQTELGLGGQTATRTVVGSPQYMAPEQLEPGTPVDARTDLWSLGVVLYELLTDVRPFDAGTLVDTMYAIGRLPHVPLTQKVPGIPAELSACVDRCLAKAPEQRFPDAASLRAALLTPGTGASVKRAGTLRWTAAAGGAAAVLVSVVLWAAVNVRAPEPPAALPGQEPAAVVEDSPVTEPAPPEPPAEPESPGTA